MLFSKSSSACRLLPGNGRLSWIGLVVALPSACTTNDAVRDFDGEFPRYDTAAIVGGAAETNPLFLFARADPALLDDSTVVYSEAGRLVVANMVTGAGWQKESGEGDEGPGEFGGSQPKIFALDNEIFTITASGAYNVFSATGSLKASGRVSRFYRPGELSKVAGFAGGRIITTYRQMFDRAGASQQSLRQGIRAYDLAGNMVMDIDTLAPVVMRIVAQDNSRNSIRTEAVGGDILVAQARGTYMVYRSGRQITTMTPEGKTIASRALDWRVWDIRIDAANRIWAFIRARDEDTGKPGIIVLDRELNEVFRVAEKFVVNGSANGVLALTQDSFGAVQFVLLWRSGTQGATPTRDSER